MSGLPLLPLAFEKSALERQVCSYWSHAYSTIVQYGEGTLWAGVASPQVHGPGSMGQAGFTPPTTFSRGAIWQGAAYRYNSSDFHCSFAVLTFNIMDKTATTRFFKLSICIFQPYPDNIPLSENC